MRQRTATTLVALSALALILVIAAPEARRWVERLDSARAAERDAAAVELLRLGDAAVPELRAAAENGSRNVRRRALSLLDVLESEPDVVPHREARALVRLALERSQLRDDSPIDRRLLAIGTPASATLADAARTRAQRGIVRSDLVEALGRHGNETTVETLVDLLRRERAAPGDVLAAARALRGRDRAIVAKLDVLEELRRMTATESAPRARASAALAVATRPDDLIVLLELSEHAAPGVRIEAARGLGARARNDRGAERLRELARDDDDDVRVAALEALLSVPGRPAPEPALANVDHPRAAVRAAAATLLGRERTPEALGALTRLQSDRSRRVRAATERARNAHRDGSRSTRR